MEVIRGPFAPSSPGVMEIPLVADRLTLAKRRWRGVAEDGCEFGFDLEAPLHDGDIISQIAGTTYVLAQRPEAVLEIDLPTPAEAARAGWLVGNLHFPLQIAGHILRVADDSALRQMLAREGLAFTEASRVFHPLHAAHAHVH